MSQVGGSTQSSSVGIYVLGGQVNFAATIPLTPEGSINDRLSCTVNPAPYHQPVLINEVAQALIVRPGGKYIDCTAGEGGHTQIILRNCIPDGHVLAIDADPKALEIARCRLRSHQSHFTPVQDNYAYLEEITYSHNFTKADGILIDLGLSSFQLEASGRGFSFQRDEQLDMRFDPSTAVTAAQIVNNSTRDELARLFKDFGEERHARTIARAIVHGRPITTSAQLGELVKRTVGPSKRGLHPATRTFQALRIAVNSELENLKQGLQQAVSLLNPGGRLVIISYHSLEDRLVKTAFQQEARGCICPPEVPQCACDHSPTLRVITRHIVTPSAKERMQNPRSRSARMRVAERLHKEDH